MPRFKRLSGSDVIKIFESLGFKVISQKGSHVKLRRVSEYGKETLIVPDHKQLDTGTCRGIVRQASQYIPLSELAKHFYS